jgi:hypothetical protein
MPVWVTGICHTTGNSWCDTLGVMNQSLLGPGKEHITEGPALTKTLDTPGLS